jgi:hypothetical protein
MIPMEKNVIGLKILHHVSLKLVIMLLQLYQMLLDVRNIYQDVQCSMMLNVRQRYVKTMYLQLMLYVKEPCQHVLVMEPNVS